jgi:hypothetical protein
MISAMFALVKRYGRLHLAAVSVTDDDLLLLRRVYSEL